MRNILALFGAIALAPTVAAAQSAPTCERQASVVCGMAKAASLGATIGDVVVLTQASATPAKNGADLKDNDRVIARDGSSEIKLGADCLVAVPKKSSALVYKPDAARVCVSVSDLQPAAVTASSTPTGLYVAGAAAAAGGVAAVVIGAKNSSKSPVSAQ